MISRGSSIGSRRTSDGDSKPPEFAFTVAGWLLSSMNAVGVAGTIIQLFWGWVPLWAEFAVHTAMPLVLGLGLIRRGNQFALPTLLWFALKAGFDVLQRDHTYPTRVVWITITISLLVSLLNSLPFALLLVGHASRKRITTGIVGFIIIQALWICVWFERTRGIERYRRSLHAHATPVSMSHVARGTARCGNA